ncbi:MAG: hypothetical protein JW955_14875 [Sedimentisphaerales bacterium]|nr:hypothetical protein [Sedimentisphaerales bacterium]
MRTDTSRRILQVLLVVLLSGVASPGAIHYVALNGSGTDGQSWATAYTSISAALQATTTVAGDEIRVKQGTYGTGMGIVVDKAVKIYGGYSGVGDTRDWQSLKSIIDGLNLASHCLNISADATIDGFTIMKGRSYGSSPSERGGGMYIHECSALVSNCSFERNYADHMGGAIFLENAGGSQVVNCTFTDNTSADKAGAVACSYSDALIQNCHFEENKTGGGVSAGYGGAMYNENCSPTILSCTFSANFAEYGAGVGNYMADTTMADCTFEDCNTATIGGGGVYNWGGAPLVSRCLFQNNRVTHRGGAIWDRSIGTVANCILWNNRSMVYGGAIYIDAPTGGASSAATFVHCTVYGNSTTQGGALYSDNAGPTLVNCILWGNTSYDDEVPEEIHYSTSVFNVKPAVSYCDVAGDTTYPGTGNLRADPKFANAPGGDLHLQAGSPCIDHGTNSAPGLSTTDYDGKPRIVDGDDNGLAVTDMGAYEVQGYTPTDHVHRGEILQGIVYESPSDTTAEYIFLLEIETDDAFDHIQFRTPAGNTFTIPNTEHTSSGNVETHHVVSGSVHLWQYWAGFSTAAGLNSYGDGTYVITYYLVGGTSREAQVVYRLAGGAPIPQPTQKPNVTSPPYGASLNGSVTLTWDACTDGNANSVFVTIINADTDQSVVGDTFPKAATSSSSYNLAQGTYDVEVSFANLNDTSDNTGVPFEVGKGVTVGHQFEVAFAVVYRFWSPVNSVHFYTISELERDMLIRDFPNIWTYEGPAYHTASSQSAAGLLPVYRFWSGHSHFYTISEDEKDMLIRDFPNVWTFEGIAFYAYPEGQQPAGTEPVYRFWNGATVCHFYTISESERDMIIRDFPSIWTFEGIAYYAYE